MAERIDEIAGTARQRVPTNGLRSSARLQFFCYLGCAGLAALVNFLVGMAIVDGLGCTSTVAFSAAVAIAYCVGMLVNFVLNRRFTFASDRRGIDQARTFIVVALSGLALTTAVAGLSRAALAAAYLGIGWSPTALGPLATFAAPDTLSRAIAIGLTSIYSFLGHKHLTFTRGIRLSLRQAVYALQAGD